MKRSGFTIVELVVVIILLGILAAIGLPRFFSNFDNASAARLEGIAGAMEASAGLFKAQWMAEGKPNAVTVEDGTLINLDPVTGFPVDSLNQTNDTIRNMGVPECMRVFRVMTKTSETATNSTNANVLRQNDFFVRRINGAPDPDTCVYYQISEELIAARPNNAGVDPRYPSLVYTPEDGRVEVANPP